MRLLTASLLLGLLGLAVAGCGKDDPVRPNVPPAEKRAWIGSFSGGSGQGDVVLDLVQTGLAFAGEIVLGGPGSPHLWVTGAMRADSMILGLDPAHSSNLADLSLRARVLANGDLSGTVKIVSTGLDAGLSCRTLPRRELVTEATYQLPTTVISMAHDGNHLWLGTLGDDYLLMDGGGAIVDTVVIYHEPAAHWASSELMFDGARLWGVYPITISGPGGLRNVADLLAFDANGRRPDSLRVGHRPSGLAHDGTSMWSLRGEPRALLRLDATGAVADSVPLGIPDAIELGFDGTHFWTTGWYLQRLYQVEPGGRVIAICDPPHHSPGSASAAIAVQGSHLWFVEQTIGGSTLSRLALR